MEIFSSGICTIQAPCKINLHLWIGERRPDGFHELESIFAALALGDSLWFESTAKEGGHSLSIKWEVPHNERVEISPEKNLVSRAVSIFREKTGFASGLRISLVKRVPVGAGLGGGSSDAACTLLALDALANTDLSGKELEEMALHLGSDVPFFLKGGTAFVSGRGEHIEPLTLPRGLWIVLVKPPFFSDTAVAFRLLDRARELDRGKFSKNKLSQKALVLALGEDPAAWPFYNDFLPVFLEEWDDEKAHPYSYQLILESLKALGASFAGLSGAGSCCFGIFNSEKAAKLAEKNLAEKVNFVKSTFFVGHKPNPVVKY